MAGELADLACDLRWVEAKAGTHWHWHWHWHPSVPGRGFGEDEDRSP